jgi:hypothetical protein
MTLNGSQIGCGLIYRKNGFYMKIKYFVWPVLIAAIVYWFVTNLSPKVSDATPKEPVSDLKSYLLKAPFEGYWNPRKGAGWGDTVTTNIDEVFPFMGKFSYAIKDTSKPFFQESESLVFKDRDWGELFVFGGITAKDEKVFLSQKYSEKLDSLVSMQQKMMLSHSLGLGYSNMLHDDYNTAFLYETKVFFEDDVTKTIVYRVFSHTDYLMVFHQKGQFVLEVAFPCDREESEICVGKVKEVNEKLTLQSDVLSNIKAVDLERSEESKYFWKDPYKKAYEAEGVQVLFPIVGTEFENSIKEYQRFSPVEKDGFSFHYVVKNHKEDVSALQMKLKRSSTETTMTKGGLKTIYLQESSDDTQLEGKATIVLSDNEYLEVAYQVSVEDKERISLMKNIVRNIFVIKNYESL